MQRTSKRNVLLASLIALGIIELSFADDPGAYAPEDYQAALDYDPQVVGQYGNSAIYTLGRFEFLEVAPDLQADVGIQTGNSNSRRKIRPKEALQISNNLIGTTPPRLPRSEKANEFPWLPVHLIDGDRTTGWMGGGFVRIDLPRAQSISRMTFWPIYHRPARFERPEGAPDFLVGAQRPARFRVRVSEDGSIWRQVAQVDDLKAVAEGPLGSIEFPEVRAKIIHIDIENLAYGFSEIEVFDTMNRNVAQIGQGANVLVGATRTGPGNDPLTTIHMWPMHWRLGAKWIRVGYWNDATNWSRVEREKGRYKLDPMTEAAIKLAAERGLKVVLTLGYGNLLYESDGREIPRAGQGYEVTWTYPVPKTAAGIEGFCGYCRFMAERFKDDVEFFEIWNEMDAPEIRSCTPPEVARLVGAAARAIREVAPEALVMLGGSGSLNLGFTSECLRQPGLAEQINAIAFHPYQMSSLPEEAAPDRTLPTYDACFNRYESELSALGFKGFFHANEQAWKAMVPPNRTKDPKLPLWSFYDVSELTKAKYLARTVMVHSSRNVPVFWNESWTGPGSLLRHNQLIRFDSEPSAANPHSIFQSGLAGMSPDASFYVMRVLGTVMDGARSIAPIPHAFSTETDNPMEVRSFGYPNGDKLLAIWLRQEAVDDFPGVEGNLTLSETARAVATGIDVLSGFEQTLETQASEGGLVLRDIRVRDYPLLIRIAHSSVTIPISDR